MTKIYRAYLYTYSSFQSIIYLYNIHPKISDSYYDLHLKWKLHLFPFCLTHLQLP